MTENAEHPLLKRTNVNMSKLNSDLFMMLSFCFTKLRCEEDGRRQHMSAVFSLCACIYGRHATERSNVAHSVIRMREKCVVCLSVKLQQIECTLTNDVMRLVAVRNENILCHSVQLFFSCAALYCHALQIQGLRSSEGCC